MIEVPSSAINYQEPDWFISEKDKFTLTENNNYWVNAVRFFSQYYNPSPNIISEDNPNENLPLVDKGIQYALYYIGKQKNIDYNHITKDMSGQTLQTLWIKSKKVKGLVDRLAGGFIEQLSAKELTAKSLSERADTQKMRLWQDVMIKYDNRFKFIYDEMAAQGISYEPMGGRVFKDKEDADRYMTYDFKDDLEIVAVQLAKYLEWINDSDTSYIQALIQDFCPANFMALYNYVENGIIKQKRIPFYNLIFNHSSEDMFVRDSNFVGFIEYIPVQKLLTQYPSLTPTERNQIKELAEKNTSANSFIETYNKGSNLKWWQYRKGQLTVMKVTMFWIAPRDTGYSKKEDKYGNTHLNKANKGGQFIINDLHKAVLVGNKYLVEYGYEDNVVRSATDKNDIELPIKIFNSSTVLGEGVSIIGQIAQLIDKMDFYAFKILEGVGKSKGKTYIVNGSKLGEGVTAKELIQDLTTMGITVTTGVTGEVNDPTNNQRIVEMIDFSLDPNITAYISLHQQIDIQVEEILSMPKIMQGMQRQMIGLGVQQKTIAQASVGMSYLWYNLFRFNTICLSHIVNLARLVFAKEDKLPPLFAIGDRGKKILEQIKEYKFEDLMIDISPKDIITEQQRVQMMAIAQAMAQNQNIDMLDFVSILQSPTFAELKNDLNFAMGKKEKERMMQQQMMIQQQQMIQQQKEEANLQQEKLRQSGQDNRAEIQQDTTFAQELARNESKQQKTTANVTA